MFSKKLNIKSNQFVQTIYARRIKYEKFSKISSIWLVWKYFQIFVQYVPSQLEKLLVFEK